MGPMLQVPMLPLNQQPTLQMYCESVSATTVEIKDFFLCQNIYLVGAHLLASSEIGVLQFLVGFIWVI